MKKTIPFLRPSPPKLSQMAEKLVELENSGIYTNNGPVNRNFETQSVDLLFGGYGSCVTVCNATIGLMVAIRQAIGPAPRRARKYALMPSFTFAATAHAAQWVGLTPLLCDIDPVTWLPSKNSEEEIIRDYSDEIAVIVPYATFGNNIDTQRYENLADSIGAGLVIDAAASLGSLDQSGKGFGAGCNSAVVYSMHATKTFSTAEAGLIYCADSARADQLRLMTNFGFGEPRMATMPGLNAKLSEVGALLALAKLEEFESVVTHRNRLANIYREQIPHLQFQRIIGERAAYQFMPALLPKELSDNRAAIISDLARKGIGLANYFSPHLAEQPWFRDTSKFGSLPVTAEISARSISLPISDFMCAEDVEYVASCFNDTLLAL